MTFIEYVLVVASWVALIAAAVVCFKIVKETEKK